MKIIAGTARWLGHKPKPIMRYQDFKVYVVAQKTSEDFGDEEFVASNPFSRKIIVKPCFLTLGKKWKERVVQYEIIECKHFVWIISEYPFRQDMILDPKQFFVWGTTHSGAKRPIGSEKECLKKSRKQSRPNP